jgi:hypothetical protein
MQPPPATIDRAFTAQTVTALAAAVEREHFSPESGTRVARALRRALADGRYDATGTLGACRGADARHAGGDCG